MTTPPPPETPRTVQYKGEDLDPERGPGLGCFRIQLAVLGVLVVLTPLSVVWSWPAAVSAALLLVVIVLLLLTGQTIIFLLRLVAADRRAAGRRRPLAGRTPTVGELEDAHRAAAGEEAVEPIEPGGAEGEPADGPGDGTGAADGEDRPTPDGDEPRAGDRPPSR